MVSLGCFHVSHLVIGLAVWCWLFKIHLKGVLAVVEGAADPFESRCEAALIIHTVRPSVLLHKFDPHLVKRVSTVKLVTKSETAT